MLPTRNRSSPDWSKSVPQNFIPGFTKPYIPNNDKTQFYKRNRSASDAYEAGRSSRFYSNIKPRRRLRSCSNAEETMSGTSSEASFSKHRIESLIKCSVNHTLAVAKGSLYKSKSHENLDTKHLKKECGEKSKKKIIRQRTISLPNDIEYLKKEIHKVNRRGRHLISFRGISSSLPDINQSEKREEMKFTHRSDQDIKKPSDANSKKGSLENLQKDLLPKLPLPKTLVAAASIGLVNPLFSYDSMRSKENECLDEKGGLHHKISKFPPKRLHSDDSEKLDIFNSLFANMKTSSTVPKFSNEKAHRIQSPFRRAEEYVHSSTSISMAGNGINDG